MPPFNLEKYKAQARNGSYDAIKKLVAVIEHLDVKDQLDIWDIFADILAESPPSMEVLKKCFLRTEAPIVRCRVVLELIQGITLTLICYESNMLQDMSLIEKLKVIWPDIWKWIHSTIFYHRHSPLPRSTLTLICDNDIPNTTSRVVMMCQFCALYLSCAGKDYLSVMLTPSFIQLVASLWHDLANGQKVHPQLHRAICLLLRLIVQFDDVASSMAIAESLGSSASFATCLLAHLRIEASEDMSLMTALFYSSVVLNSRLTEDIQRELHAQHSVQVAINILERVEGVASSLGAAAETLINMIEYLSRSMLTAGQTQARVVFKSRILPALASAVSRFDEPPEPLSSAIAALFDILGQFCLYRSNIKALTQAMDELGQGNLQIHFETPGLNVAWSLFMECFAEGKRVKERRDSGLKICTSCGTKAFRKHFYQCGHCRVLYCNTVCQALDWRGGNHRKVCVNHDFLMPHKDFETIVHRARMLIARFSPRLALFYQKFVVFTQRNDLPPLLCIVDMTCFPQMITLHPDLSDAAYAQIGNVVPLRLAQSHPCLLVFALLPPAACSTRLLIHDTLQPSPTYTSYQEFLDKSPEPSASVAQIQLDISSGSLFADISFQWVTGGEWDVGNTFI